MSPAERTVHDRPRHRPLGAGPAVIVVGPLPPPMVGAARVTELLTGQLRRDGVGVLAVDTSGTTDRSRLRYHLSRAASHLRALRAVRSVHGAPGRPATVYLAGAGGLGLWYQLAVVRAARRAGHRIVFHHHNYSCVRRPRLALRLLIRGGGRQLVHVVLSERMGRALSSTYRGMAEVLVCSNAGLLPAPSPGRTGPPHRPDRPPVLGHLSNLCTDKGLDTVLATLRELRAGGTRAQLLLAGPTRDARSGALVAAAQREFGDALHYLGPLAPEDVEAFYRQLDLFLFPSRYRHEAEPLVILEAARCGVPTVAFDVGAVEALVPDDGWLVPVGADFPIAVQRQLRRMGSAAARESVCRAVIDHFAARRHESVLAYERLAARLADPAGAGA